MFNAINKQKKLSKDKWRKKLWEAIPKKNEAPRSRAVPSSFCKAKLSAGYLLN